MVHPNLAAAYDIVSCNGAPRYLRMTDIIGVSAVTPAQAEHNRRTGRSPVRARDARRGVLNVSKATFWRLQRAGFPQPLRIGRAVMWDEREVLAWIEAHRSRTDRPPGAPAAAQGSHQRWGVCHE